MEEDTKFIDEFIFKTVFREYCRLCAKEKDECLMDVINDKKLVQKIKNLFKVKIQPNDEWHKICVDCHQKLEICHNFYEEVQNAQNFLRELPVYLEECNDEEKVIVKDEFRSEIQIKPEVILEAPPVVENLEIIIKEGKAVKTPLIKKVALYKITEQNHQINKFYKFTCPFCTVISESFETYETHMKNEHQEDNPTVTCCDTSIPCIRQRLLDHLLLHERPDDLKCKECGKKCINKKALRHHKLNHNRNLPCPDCGKRFYHKKALESHIISFHIPENERKLYQCHFCSAERATKLSILNHLITQHKMEVDSSLCKNKNFLCPHCAKHFTNKSSFDCHIKFKHDVIMVKCPDCGMECNKKVLYRHRKIHEDVAQTCPICSKIFKNKQRLKTHMRYAHETRPPVKCDICEKEFKAKDKMMDHRKIHFIGKPFKCDLCDVTTADYANILKHRKQVHTNADPIPHGMGRQILEIGYVKRKNKFDR